MRKIILTLVVAKKESAAAEAIKNEVQTILPSDSICSTFEKYEKITGCHKMVFEINVPENENEAVFNYKLLTLSSSLARPWMIFFQDNYATELIFNRTDASSYNRQTLNTIIWGHIQQI